MNEIIDKENTEENNAVMEDNHIAIKKKMVEEHNAQKQERSPFIPLKCKKNKNDNSLQAYSIEQYLPTEEEAKVLKTTFQFNNSFDLRARLKPVIENTIDCKKLYDHTSIKNKIKMLERVQNHCLKAAKILHDMHYQSLVSLSGEVSIDCPEASCITACADVYLESLGYACMNVNARLGKEQKDGGGKPQGLLTNAIISKLVEIFEEGTGETATCYSSAAEALGYGGDFYKFVMNLSKILTKKDKYLTLGRKDSIGEKLYCFLHPKPLI